MALGQAEGQLEVVELVLGVERREVEQLGVVGVDQRTEGQAVAPAVVEVLDLDPAADALGHLMKR